MTPCCHGYANPVHASWAGTGETSRPPGLSLPRREVYGTNPLHGSGRGRHPAFSMFLPSGLTPKHPPQRPAGVMRADPRDQPAGLQHDAPGTLLPQAPRPRAPRPAPAGPPGGSHVAPLGTPGVPPRHVTAHVTVTEPQLRTGDPTAPSPARRDRSP